MSHTDVLLVTQTVSRVSGYEAAAGSEMTNQRSKCVAALGQSVPVVWNYMELSTALTCVPGSLHHYDYDYDH